MRRVWGPAAFALGALLAALPAAAQVRLRPGVTVQSLEQAAVRDSNDPVALYDLALGYWSKKRWDDAERTLNAALAIEPRNAPTLMALAHLPYARRPQLWQEEDQGEVPAEWQPALIRRDRLTRLAYLVDPLVDLQIVGAVAPKESSLLQRGAGAERYAQVGFASFRSAQYDQAFAWFDRLARLLGGEADPDRVPDIFLWYRGLSAAHLNDIPAALKDFELLHRRGAGQSAAERSVDPALASYVYAYLLHRAGRSPDAIAVYQRALEGDLGLWMAHVQLARIHEERGEWENAVGERRLAAEAAGDDPTLLLDLGVTLDRAHRPAEADTVLARAAAQLPRTFRVPYFQGLVALELGHPEQARAAFLRFLALVPGRYVSEIREVRSRLRSPSLTP